MTNAELIAALLCMPYHEPVEIETEDGVRLEITGVDRIGWGIKLETTYAVADSDTLQDARKAISEKVQQVTEMLYELSEDYGDQ